MTDCYLILSNDVYDQLHQNFCSYLRKSVCYCISVMQNFQLWTLSMICHYSTVVAVVIV